MTYSEQIWTGENKANSRAETNEISMEFAWLYIPGSGVVNELLQGSIYIT